MRQIECAGRRLPVDFSIMTVLELCDIYHTDITGLGALFAAMKSQREQMQFVIDAGVIALNDGAKRSGDNTRYTEYDLRDMLTQDPSFSEKLINGLFDTFTRSEVFAEPPKSAAPHKKKSKG